MKASLEPLSTQFEQLLTGDPELTAAEERMIAMRSETLEEARARTQNFFQALGAQMGQQIATYKIVATQPIPSSTSLGLGQQVATTRDIAVASPQTFMDRPDSTAPDAGAFPSTAEEFAKYAANRRPLRIDD